MSATSSWDYLVDKRKRIPDPPPFPTPETRAKRKPKLKTRKIPDNSKSALAKTKSTSKAP